MNPRASKPASKKARHQQPPCADLGECNAVGCVLIGSFDKTSGITCHHVNLVVFVSCSKVIDTQLEGLQSTRHMFWFTQKCAVELYQV